MEVELLAVRVLESLRPFGVDFFREIVLVSTILSLMEKPIEVNLNEVTSDLRST